MKKQIWELTLDDLSKYPVWYFPMVEEGDSDEATVMPADEKHASGPNTQIIVYSDFFDSKGKHFKGYIYIAEVEISTSQPCMYIEGVPTNFWFGLVKPKEELKRLSFPIVATSLNIFGVSSHTIRIENYGYYNEEFETCWVDY